MDIASCDQETAGIAGHCLCLNLASGSNHLHLVSGSAQPPGGCLESANSYHTPG